MASTRRCALPYMQRSGVAANPCRTEQTLCVERGPSSSSTSSAPEACAIQGSPGLPRLLIVLLVVFLLGGGGWGYSRYRRG